MRVKSTVLRLKDDLDGYRQESITLEQLRDHDRNFKGQARIAPVEGGGWTLDFRHRYLLTQRGQIRCFKSIEAVCVLLHHLGVHDFRVALQAVAHDQRKVVKWQPGAALRLVKEVGHAQAA
jgi:hypothetical protein